MKDNLLKVRLTTARLLEITGIPRRRFYQWVESGWLPPIERVEGRGPGNSDWFDGVCAWWAMTLFEILNLWPRSQTDIYLARIDDKKGSPYPGRWNMGDYWIGPLALSSGAQILSYLRDVMEGEHYEPSGYCAVIDCGYQGNLSNPLASRFVEIRVQSVFKAMEELASIDSWLEESKMVPRRKWVRSRSMINMNQSEAHIRACIRESDG